MSTTRGAPAGVVRMIDPPDDVRKKFKTAVTDSGTEVRHDPEEKPGVSNLIEIMAVATGKSISEVESRFDGQGYGTFKEDVAEAVVELLAPIQARYEELRADEGELRRMLAVGAEKAREAARRRSRRCTSGWALSGRNALALAGILASASSPASSTTRTPSRWPCSSSLPLRSPGSPG